jgi:hypothetical protein
VCVYECLFIIRLRILGFLKRMIHYFELVVHSNDAFSKKRTKNTFRSYLGFARFFNTARFFAGSFKHARFLRAFF